MRALEENLEKTRTMLARHLEDTQAALVDALESEHDRRDARFDALEQRVDRLERKGKSKD